MTDRRANICASTDSRRVVEAAAVLFIAQVESFSILINVVARLMTLCESPDR